MEIDEQTKKNLTGLGVFALGIGTIIGALKINKNLHNTQKKISEVILSSDPKTKQFAEIKNPEKIEKVMKEFKNKKLHSGKTKKIVTKRKQAVAIALNEARK